MRSDLVGIFGIVCLALFAFAVWPPLAILVVGVAAILISYVTR